MISLMDYFNFNKLGGKAASFALKYLIICFISFIFLTACTDEDKPYNSFKSVANRYSGKIDGIGCDSLMKIVYTAEAGKLKTWLDTSKKVIMDSINSNIMPLSCGDSALKVNYGPYKVSLYIENSASMDGYINRSTAFKTHLINLIGNLEKERDIVDLFYINDKYIKRDTTSSDAKSIIRDLNLRNFQEKGVESIKGGLDIEARNYTELKQIVDSVISKVTDTSFTILVSDFIISVPKEKAKTPKEVLNFIKGKSAEFENTIAKKFHKIPNLSLLVLRQTSDFNGCYYSESEGGKAYIGKTESSTSCSKQVPTKIEDFNRPYFIWVFGTQQQIEKVLNTSFIKNIGENDFWLYSKHKGGIEIEVEEEDLSFANDNFSYLNHERGVDIKKDSLLATFKSNKFLRIPVKLNFGLAEKLMPKIVDVKNKDNWHVNNNFTVESISEMPNDKKWSHRLVLKSKNSFTKKDEIPVKPLVIELSKNLDTATIGTVSADNDVPIDENKKKVLKEETLGIKYLFESIHSVFYLTPIDSFSIKIGVK